MEFVVVGCSYRTAPLELREKLAFASNELPQTITRLCAASPVAEAMVVSTCNRVEIYGVANDGREAEQTFCRALLEARGLDSGLRDMVYRLENEEAVRHIFRVTSSLDAMVVGEAQVMGQVKDAFSLAREHHGVGPLLGRAMERAFFVAKRVRTETAIARHPASISSVAVDLAGRIFAELSRVAVLIVGAGEMAELAGRHLLSHGCRRIRVANRSLENGQALARQLEGTAVPFDELEEQLQWADVVISSTGSPKPIMNRKLLNRVMKKRKQRTSLIVDIAVPRDVDLDARDLDNLYLFDVDALQQVVGENLEARRKEAKSAEAMVEKEVGAFFDWVRRQQAVPVIKQLRQHFTEVARKEAQKTVRKMKLGGKDEKTLQKLADAIVGKLLHGPMVELKKAADSADAADLSAACRQLFQLEQKTTDDTAKTASSDARRDDPGLSDRSVAKQS
jgi:glutamyl-tRNA reductase